MKARKAHTVRIHSTSQCPLRLFTFYMKGYSDVDEGFHYEGIRTYDEMPLKSNSSSYERT